MAFRWGGPVVDRAGGRPARPLPAGPVQRAPHGPADRANASDAHEVGIMPDPGVTMNCPLCGVRLTYLRTEEDTHIYHCLRHGALMLSPDGRMRQASP
jgi:hypothetical protein